MNGSSGWTGNSPRSMPSTASQSRAPPSASALSSSSRVPAERHERLFLLECDVSCTRRIPRSAVPSFERLGRARAVYGELKCAIAVWRPAQLVVHDTQRTVREKVDPIRLCSNRNRSRGFTSREFERIAELVLEQAFNHGRVLLDLEPTRVRQDLMRPRNPTGVCVQVRDRLRRNKPIGLPQSARTDRSPRRRSPSSRHRARDAAIR